MVDVCELLGVICRKSPILTYSPAFGASVGDDPFLANANVRVRYLLSRVRLSSVTFMRPTQEVEIFGSISTALGTLAIH